MATVCRARSFSSAPTRPRIDRVRELVPRCSTTSSSTSRSPSSQGCENSHWVLTTENPRRCSRCRLWNGAPRAPANQSSTKALIMSKKFEKYTIPVGSQWEKRMRNSLPKRMGGFILLSWTAHREPCRSDP